MKYKNQNELALVLYKCAAACYNCASECLEEKNVSMLRRCIELDTDCAGICQLTASFISRGSAHAMLLLDECAEICNICADECEKHSHMEHCKRCAEICRHCAEMCSQMIAA